MKDNLTFLITGGTGSFGRAFVDTVLRECNPRSIRVYSRDELKQFEMQERLQDPRVRYLIGDIRDSERLTRAMDGVDVVVHAAALKQVVTAEYNPIEAVRTNIDGTINVINASIDKRVPRLMFLSTDKAVAPVNLYGATKMAAERVCVNGNVYGVDTLISCVRYGNVLGSRGSVVNTFLRQREQGVLTLTDPGMTRFWITVEQGVRFVLHSLDRMVGGEVFIPKIPASDVQTLADAIAPDARHEVIGARPGEKRHESLIGIEESVHTLEYEDCYVIDFHGRLHEVGGHGGIPADAPFEFRSDIPGTTLTANELAELIKSAESAKST